MQGMGLFEERKRSVCSEVSDHVECYFLLSEFDGVLVGRVQNHNVVDS